MSFVIDKTGSSGQDEPKFKRPLVKLSASLDPGKEVTGYLPSNPLDAFNLLSKSSIGNKSNQIYDSKCVLKDGQYLDNQTIQPRTVSRRMKKKQRKEEEEKSAGHGWYNMPATEVTPEIKQDLKVLKLRGILDPSRHYRKHAIESTPKFFQVGTIQGTSADYYNDLTRKQKKQTLVEELMADREVRKYHKAKAVEIIKKNPYYVRMTKRKLTAKQRRKAEEKILNEHGRDEPTVGPGGKWESMVVDGKVKKAVKETRRKKVDLNQLNEEFKLAAKKKKKFVKRKKIKS